MFKVSGRRLSRNAHRQRFRKHNNPPPFILGVRAVSVLLAPQIFSTLFQRYRRISIAVSLEWCRSFCKFSTDNTILRVKVLKFFSFTFFLASFAYRIRAPPHMGSALRESITWRNPIRGKNLGMTEDEVLQNKFTAYLTSAIHRRRKDYVRKLIQEKKAFPRLTIYSSQHDLIRCYEPQMNLPLMMTIHSEPLLLALQQLGQRERYVMIACALKEKDFASLAAELNLSYKGVAAIYYRARQKVKWKMEDCYDNEGIAVSGKDLG